MSHISKTSARLPALARMLAIMIIAAVGVLAGNVASAAPEPVSTGCPPSFQHLSLTFLASQGPYQQPFTLDAAGNNNGYVCGKPTNEASYDAVCGPTCPVPVLYNFIDDTLTPAN